MKNITQYTVFILNMAVWNFLRGHTKVQCKFTSLGPVPKIDLLKKTLAK